MAQRSVGWVGHQAFGSGRAGPSAGAQGPASSEASSMADTRVSLPINAGAVRRAHTMGPLEPRITA